MNGLSPAIRKGKSTASEKVSPSSVDLKTSRCSASSGGTASERVESDVGHDRRVAAVIESTVVRDSLAVPARPAVVRPAVLDHDGRRARIAGDFAPDGDEVVRTARVRGHTGLDLRICGMVLVDPDIRGRRRRRGDEGRGDNDQLAADPGIGHNVPSPLMADESSCVFRTLYAHTEPTSRSTCSS